MSETLDKVWRGVPALGQDTEAILKKVFGYDKGAVAR